MKILLLGFGNVGRSLAAILAEKRGINAQVIGIVTKQHGSVVKASGLPIAQMAATFEERGRFDSSLPEWSPIDAPDATGSLNYDVLVELTTLSIDHRGEPATSHVRTALRRKKHVVCANKGPVAFAYQELRTLAAGSGRRLLFESTVMDGAPVFSLARSGLLGCNVTAVSGILNSTTNFVLSQMEQGHSLQEAVAQAQQKGIAEADPRNDLEGWDAAAKICVLWNVLGNGNLTPERVERQGITDIRPEDLARTLSRSRRMKLVARAWKEPARERATVKLEEVPLEDPFATVSGTGSILKIETDCMTPILVMQENPTVRDTAYGVLNDLLTIAAS
jgi:homoserine dehydrogenase